MKNPLLALAVGLSALGAFAAEPYKIAVIPKGTTHSFWKAVEAGARKAAGEAGVEIIWKGPAKEDDRAQQIKVVEQFVASGVNAIVLAPLDDAALLAPVQAARAKNIPVVIFDSALKGEIGKDFASFVATDNFRGGELAGEEMGRLLRGAGKVVVLRYTQGSASTAERENGFIAASKKAGLVVSSDDAYAGPTSAGAQEAATKLLEALRAADGVFCPNEPTTVGMLLALRQGGLAGKMKFIGFDTSETLQAGLDGGEIHALVAQSPARMGYLGVLAAVKALKGENVDPRIDTGCELVTKQSRTAKK